MSSARSTSGGSTIRALRLTAQLRLQGSALAAALASPAVSSALADVSYRTGAGHTTGLSVVYHESRAADDGRPRIGRECRAGVRGRVAGRLTASSTRRRTPSPSTAVRRARSSTGTSWPSTHPDFYDDERSMPALADRKVLRRRGRVTVRRGFLRPPMSAEAVARMVELRAQGLGFKRIARAVGCAPITVSRYLRSFEEEGR